MTKGATRRWRTTARQSDFSAVVAEAPKQRGSLFLPPTSLATVHAKPVQGKIPLNSDRFTGNGTDRDGNIDTHLVECPSRAALCDKSLQLVIATPSVAVNRRENKLPSRRR